MSAQIKSSRSINLLPGQQIDETTSGKVLKWLLSTFRTIVILVQIVVIGGFAGRIFVDTRLSALNKEIEDKHALVSSYADIEKTFRSTQLKLQTYAGLQGTENKMVPVLDAISQQISADIQLISISKSNNLLIIRARTTQETSMYSFVSRVGTIESIQNAQVVEILQDTNNSSLSEFVIHATVPTLANPIS